MAHMFYPAILYPVGDDGLAGVVIPGININVSGKNDQAALVDASQILQEVIDDFHLSGEPIPAPMPIHDIDAQGGILVMIPATTPDKSIRVNITLPADLIKRIDAVAPNRSAFLAESALERLRNI